MKLIAMGLALVSSAATAGTPLWKGIEAGMTPAQVQTLFPAGEDRGGKWIVKDIEITPKCDAKLIVFYRSGTVIKVALEGKRKWGGSNCGNDLHGALLAKYGEPIDREDKRGDIAKNWGLKADAMTWSKDGVMVRFNRNTTSANVLPWTMEYDASGQQIDL